MKKASKNIKPGNTSGFISFSQVASQPMDSAELRSPKAGEVLPIYMGSHPELLVISKKIAKKNEVTRMKSLQELLDVLQTLETHYLPEFLPFFVYVYHRLALDNKRAVRERLNLCLTRLFVIDKRAFRPHMANLIGTLWMLRGDPYKEVSDSSRCAFEAAFPPKKRMEVLAHLSKDILQFAAEKLSQTAEQLSDMSQCSVEEASERHERITCSLLTSLTLLLQQLHASPHLASMLPHAHLALNDKLWKKLTSKRTSVRRCSYELLSVVMQCASSVAAECDVARLSNIVFNAFHAEQESGNIDALCHALVNYMGSGVAEWTESQWKKIVAGDLSNLLYAHPRAMHNLLPIISTVPTTILVSSISALLSLIERQSTQEVAGECVHAGEALTYIAIRSCKQVEPPQNAILEELLRKLAHFINRSIDDHASDSSDKSISALLAQIHRYRLGIESGSMPSAWDDFFWEPFADTCPLTRTSIICISDAIILSKREENMRVCGAVIALDRIAQRIAAALPHAEVVLHLVLLCCDLVTACENCLVSLGTTSDDACKKLSSLRDECVLVVSQYRCVWFRNLISSGASILATHQNANILLSIIASKKETIADLWVVCRESNSRLGVSLLLHCNNSSDVVSAINESTMEWLRHLCHNIATEQSEQDDASLVLHIWCLMAAMRNGICTSVVATSSIAYHFALLSLPPDDSTVFPLAQSLAALACSVNNGEGADGSGIGVMCSFADVWSAYSSRTEIVAGASVRVQLELSRQLHVHEWSAQKWAEVACRLGLMINPSNTDVTPTDLMSTSFWQELVADISNAEKGASAYATLSYISHVLFALDATCMSQNANAFRTFFYLLSDASLSVAVAMALCAADSHNRHFTHEIKDLRDLVHALLISDSDVARKQSFVVKLIDVTMVPGACNDVYALKWLLGAALHGTTDTYDSIILETPLVSDRCGGFDVRYVAIDDGKYTLMPATCVAEHRQAGEAPYYSVSIRDDNGGIRDIQTEAQRILIRWSDDLIHQALVEGECDLGNAIVALDGLLPNIHEFDDATQEVYCALVAGVLMSKFSGDVETFVANCRIAIVSSMGEAAPRSLVALRLLSALCSCSSKGLGNGVWITSVIPRLPTLVPQCRDLRGGMYVLLSTLVSLMSCIRSRQLVLDSVTILQQFGCETIIADEMVLHAALMCIAEIQKCQKNATIPFVITMDGDLIALQIAFGAFYGAISEVSTIENAGVAIHALDSLLQKGDRSSTQELLGMDSTLIRVSLLRDAMLSPTHVPAVRVQCGKVLDILQTAAVYTGSDLPGGDGVLDDAALACEQLQHILQHISTGADMIHSMNLILSEGDWLRRDEATMVGSIKGESDTLGAMLQWLIVLQTVDGIARQTNACQGSLRAAVGSYYLRNGKWMEFMSFLLGVLERGPEVDEAVSGAYSRLQADKEHFEDMTSDGTMKLVSYAIFRTVCCLPAAVRSWWSDALPRASKNYVAKFVEAHVIGSIVRREAMSVRVGAEKSLWSQDELEVRCNVASREVVTTYHRDEVSIEMVMHIPKQYPLKNIDIKCSNRMGIPESRWRRWTLQIIQLLSQQDGTILDALLLWKANVDKEFEGVEPCPICYSILHPKTLCMPSLTCPTCKNKFHSTCLYTWFKSSGKNKCVLCQQPFFMPG